MLNYVVQKQLTWISISVETSALDGTDSSTKAPIHVVCLLLLSSHPSTDATYTQAAAIMQHKCQHCIHCIHWLTHVTANSFSPSRYYTNRLVCVVYTQVTVIAHPSFSIRCREHMLMAVCRTREPSALLLTTMLSIRGPAIRSCLVPENEGERQIVCNLNRCTYTHTEQ